MDVKIRLQQELIDTFAEATLAATMIGYATSGNERDSHKAALSKAREKFVRLLSHVDEVCDGPI